MRVLRLTTGLTSIRFGINGAAIWWAAPVLFLFLLLLLPLLEHS